VIEGNNHYWEWWAWHEGRQAWADVCEQAGDVPGAGAAVLLLAWQVGAPWRSGCGESRAGLPPPPGVLLLLSCC
jgi:hypothetical protein